MSKTGIIISGGDISKKDNIKDFISSEAVVVCADYGYVYAGQNGISPTAVIGDFDSIAEVGGEIPHGNFETEVFKVEKDQSDTQLCVDYLLKKNIKNIIIFGALGGKRFDHSFANIQLLEYGKKRGANIRIINGCTEIFLVDSEKIEISGKIGDCVSVFALHNAKGVSYSGLKYPLENAEIKSDVPFGLSNSMTKETAEVSVKKGELLIMHIGGDSFEKE